MCGSGSTAAALRSRELRKRLLQSIRKVVRVPLHMPVNSKMGCWLSPCPSPPLQRLRGCYTSPSLGPQSVTPIEAINRAEGRGDTRHVGGSPGVLGSEERAIHPPANESFSSCRSCSSPPATSRMDAGEDGWRSVPAAGSAPSDRGGPVPAHGGVLVGEQSPPFAQINWGRAKRSRVKFSPGGFQSSGLLLLSHFIIMNNKEILTHGSCKLFIACTARIRAAICKTDTERVCAHRQSQTTALPAPLGSPH